MKSGEITYFNVKAKCPHCEQDTQVFQSELIEGEVGCIHCDEVFELEIDEGE